MFKTLVVEDDKDLNRSVCTFLKQNGYDAVGCPGANKAYDAMYDTVFDLIISDIMMPGVDGYEFAKTIRSLNSEIPILFMTARDDIGSMQKGYGIGIDDYMTKPVNFDELLLRIGALLRRAKIVNAENLPEQERKEYAGDYDRYHVSEVSAGSHLYVLEDVRKCLPAVNDSLFKDV